MSSAVYMVTTEIVDRLLRPAAQAYLIRLLMAGAKPHPLAMLRLLGGALVARYAFQEPIRTADGEVAEFQAVLSVHPEGGLG